jgi:hypothetical protein
MRNLAEKIVNADIQTTKNIKKFSKKSQSGKAKRNSFSFF